MASSEMEAMIGTVRIPTQTGGKQRRKLDRVVERLQHLRGDEAQCEQAEHHRRDACQRLNDRLDDLTDAAGVLGEVERNTQPHWARQCNCDAGDPERADEEGPHVEDPTTRKPANPCRLDQLKSSAEELRCLAEDVPR